MANWQVKNVPDERHERLRRYAQAHNGTLRASILTAVERELAHWELPTRLQHRPKTQIGVEAAALLRAERAQCRKESGDRE